MSKIGKKPIVIPNGVTVTETGGELIIKGPLGEDRFSLPYRFELKRTDEMLMVEPAILNKKNRMLWGTTRALLNNKIRGVSQGFERQLILEGLGYTAELQENKIIFRLGYTHPVEVLIPAGLTVELKPQKGLTVINVRGIDKEQVGQFSAKLRKLKPADRYKLKGFRYVDEVIKKKPIKKSAK
jgi:large subunit ribosomal protein L6